VRFGSLVNGWSDYQRLFAIAFGGFRAVAQSGQVSFVAR
jgi:hypothetical protein